MPMYRVLRDLSRNEKIIPRGTLTRLQWLNEEQQQKLMDVGAVSRLGTPPLAVLPGWQTRAKKLASFGILTAEEFLEAETGDLARMLKARAETVEKWKAEVLAWLTVPEVERG